MNEVTKMKPLLYHYLDEDILGDEYCHRVGCNACFGSDINGEPNGYGCEGRENFTYENDELIVDFSTGYFILEKKITELKAKLEKCREALEFYGHGQWEEFVSYGGIFDTIENDTCWAFNGSGDNDGDDAGERARQCLKEVFGEKK